MYIIKKRTLLPGMLVLLLAGFCLFGTHPAATSRLGDFVPALFASAALTQDTARLPAVRFIVAGRALRPEVEAHLVEGIRFMYQFYILKFDYAFPEDLTITIRVFEEYADYKTYTAHITTSPIASHTGLYIYDTREIVVWKGADATVFKKLVFHETSHLLLRSQSRFCPRWLSEGLSEYFEGLDLSGRRPVVHPQLRKDKRMKKRRLAGKLPTLEAFLAQTDQQWSAMDNQSPVPRTLAWSLVYFLMESEGGQQTVKALLARYQGRLVGPDRLVALVNTLATPGFASLRPGLPVKLGNEWHRWVARARKAQQITLGRAQPKGSPRS